MGCRACQSARPRERRDGRTTKVVWFVIGIDGAEIAQFETRAAAMASTVLFPGRRVVAKRVEL